MTQRLGRQRGVDAASRATCWPTAPSRSCAGWATPSRSPIGRWASASIATTCAGRNERAPTTGGARSATAGRRPSRSGTAPVRWSSSPVNMFSGRVEPDDPPVTAAGMHQISLDARRPRHRAPQRAARDGPGSRTRHGDRGGAAVGHGVRGRRTRSAHLHGRDAAVGPARLLRRDRRLGRPDAGASQSAGPGRSGGVRRAA